jgi:L-idonate 5-dehydrogenase
VRPRGVIVKLGLGVDMTIPINLITAKELELRGTFRLHEEFALALEFKPLDKARDPFELAGDRSQSMKVQIAF